MESDSDGGGSKQAVSVSFQAYLPLPNKLHLCGNLAANLNEFKRAWQNYEIASRLDQSTKQMRTATSLTFLGSNALDVPGDSILKI